MSYGLVSSSIAVGVIIKTLEKKIESGKVALHNNTAVERASLDLAIKSAEKTVEKFRKALVCGKARHFLKKK